MYKYIKFSHDVFNQLFTIDVIYLFDDLKIAAAENLQRYNVPVGPVISGDKNAYISEQMLADYNSFIQSIRDLVDHYNFEVTSESDSDDNSHYYELVAKRSDESWIVKFRVVLRATTHEGHRNKRRQQRKKEFEKNSKIPEDLKPKFKTLPQLNIIINDNEFDSYNEAFLYVDDKLETQYEIMSRSDRYRKNNL